MQSGNGLVQRACIFTVQVSLDGQEPYTATCKQRIPDVQIPEFSSIGVHRGGGAGQLRGSDADCAGPADGAAQGIHRAGGLRAAHSAAHILETGEPAKAVIVEFQSLNKRNQASVEIYAYTLTVIPSGRDPYQIQVGNPTPPAALPFLFAGSHVPVKIGSIPNAVVIDWDQAVAAQATQDSRA